MKIRMKRIWCRNLPQKAPDSDVQRLPVRPLGEGKFHDGAAAEEGSAVKEREETSMQTTIMLLFYGFLAGILVMCAGFSTRKRASRRVAETISAAGGTLSACCF